MVQQRYHKLLMTVSLACHKCVIYNGHQAVAQKTLKPTALDVKHLILVVVYTEQWFYTENVCQTWDGSSFAWHEPCLSTKECKDTTWWVLTNKQTCSVKLQVLFLSQMQLEHSESARMQRIAVLYENDQSISYCTVFFYMEIAVWVSVLCKSNVSCDWWRENGAPTWWEWFVLHMHTWLWLF